MDTDRLDQADDAEPNEERVTLSAIRGLLKEELLTVTQSVGRLAQDVATFKSKVSDELSFIGLRVKTMED